MVDVVYKRSFYDTLCRGAVSLGLLYAAFQGGVSWKQYRISKMDYSIVEVQSKEWLVDNEDRTMIPITDEIFGQTTHSENTNKVTTIDRVIDQFRR
jgi:hypothetical protein